MTCLEREQEGEMTGEVLAPTGKTVASHNQRLLKLSIQLRRQFRIDKLGQRLGNDAKSAFVCIQDIVKLGIKSMQNAKQL
jgi:hypothetical protein